MLKISGITGSQKDKKTVNTNRKLIEKLPEGVSFKEIPTHVDDRGTLCEVYDVRWNWHKAPVVFSYFFTVRPGIVKGWGVHKSHDDRYCIMFGEVETVLYDAREDSKTFGQVFKVYLTETNRRLINIPAGVWHADRNIGTKDAVILNFPTIVYDHDSPVGSPGTELEFAL